VLLDRTFELRLKPVESLARVVVLRLRVPEVRADLVEIVGEPLEVALEVGDVRHHLVRVLLDLHAAESQRDHLQVGGECRRRDREDAPLIRVREERARLSACELVVHGLDGDVHEGEVVRPLVGPDVLA
jgi:hypothetical protein